jgi:hypothetical protein
VRQRWAKQKEARLAAEAKSKMVDHGRLKDIGREIKVRVGKLDQLGGKAVDMVDSIDHLLADAKKLCSPKGFTFEDFKKTYCPEFGQSRTYELLAIREGRKTIEEIRADTRKRVAKHREAAKQEDVTESDSVTSPPEGEALEPKTDAPAAAPITVQGERDIEAVKAHKFADEAPPADARKAADDLTIPPFMDRRGEARAPAEPNPMQLLRAAAKRDEAPADTEIDPDSEVEPQKKASADDAIIEPHGTFLGISQPRHFIRRVGAAEAEEFAREVLAELADDPARMPPGSPAETSAQAPIETPATNGKPDDDHSLAKKLFHALNEALLLCADQNNWLHLSNNKKDKDEFRAAMKKLQVVREVLPRLATPPKSKPAVH